MYNFQKRPIRAPGWQLSWIWAKNEVIWTTLGCQATHQGDCSKFKNYIPASCKKSPTIVDLSPHTPFNQQVENCCRGGLLDAWSNKPQSRSISSFQLSVGLSGNTNRDVKLPKNFNFKAPGGKYTCGPAKVIERTNYITRDKRRFTRALSKFLFFHNIHFVFVHLQKTHTIHVIIHE